jgi:hypothetical protein
VAPFATNDDSSTTNDDDMILTTTAITSNGGAAMMTNDTARPSELQLHQSGLYVEIKEAAWQLADAGIDLVDSLVQHIKQGLGMNKMTSTTVLPDGTTAAAAGSANIWNTGPV